MTMAERDGELEKYIGRDCASLVKGYLDPPDAHVRLMREIQQIVPPSVGSKWLMPTHNHVNAPILVFTIEWVRMSDLHSGYMHFDGHFANGSWMMKQNERWRPFIKKYKRVE